MDEVIELTEGGLSEAAAMQRLTVHGLLRTADAWGEPPEVEAFLARVLQRLAEFAPTPIQ